MSSTRRKSRRYTELVQAPTDGPREHIEVGCWAVAADLDLTRPIVLVLVSGGPHFRRTDGTAFAAYWQAHDGTWHLAYDLTRLDLAGVLEEATAALQGLRTGKKPPDSDDVILRIHRVACLARRALDAGRQGWPVTLGLDADSVGTLQSLVAIDVAIADAELAWREMLRTWLPNLARAIAAAAACELARCPFWTPGMGIPHPLYPFTETTADRNTARVSQTAVRP